jgi:putative membrane protein
LAYYATKYQSKICVYEVKSIKNTMPKFNLNLFIHSLTVPQMAVLTIWVLLMISFPFLDWMLGWEAMLNAVILGSLAQLIAVIMILWQAWGATRTLSVGLTIFFLGWVAEFLGSRTGFPFGAYSYTDILQPQILGVPIQIPLGWLMMLPPSWAVAQAITGRSDSRWRLLTFIGLSALAMTTWDLLMDPMMVSWGMWEWQNPGGYFGIPWSNYLGWLLVSALITLIIRPRDLPVAPLLLIYTVTWLLKMGGMFLFWDLPGPSLLGGLVMGVLSILGWHASLKTQHSFR